jgi:hypothetical protein
MNVRQQFKKITQSYCYLLNKYEEDNEFSEKIAKPVHNQDYKEINAESIINSSMIAIGG